MSANASPRSADELAQIEQGRNRLKKFRAKATKQQSSRQHTQHTPTDHSIPTTPTNGDSVAQLQVRCQCLTILCALVMNSVHGMFFGSGQRVNLHPCPTWLLSSAFQLKPPSCRGWCGGNVAALQTNFFLIHQQQQTSSKLLCCRGQHSLVTLLTTLPSLSEIHQLKSCCRSRKLARCNCICAYPSCFCCCCSLRLLGHEQVRALVGAFTLAANATDAQRATRTPTPSH